MVRDRACSRCASVVATKRIRGIFVCDSCKASPPLVEYECPDCGRAHKDAYYNSRCGPCRRKKHYPQHPCADCGVDVTFEATRCRTCANRHGFKLHERGEPFLTPKGYMMRFVPSSDPMVSMANRLGQVLEHRLVMADHLGRPLLSAEIVHHVDENPLNNDPSNLRLMTRGAHTRLHNALREGRKECGDE